MGVTALYWPFTTSATRVAQTSDMDFLPPYPELHMQRRDPDHYFAVSNMAQTTAASGDRTPALLPSSSEQPSAGAFQGSSTISLTSLRDRDDVRTVKLELWTPQVVGRASKTKSKNLVVASDNTLFDCPVISRHHAEIELQYILGREQVVIRDTGSTHGTRVNGSPLEHGNQRSIRKGDVIQLGEKVTRGDGTLSYTVEQKRGAQGLTYGITQTPMMVLCF